MQTGSAFTSCTQVLISDDQMTLDVRQSVASVYGLGSQLCELLASRLREGWVANIYVP